MRTAIVTGGARGIGRAICERLAKENVNIVFNYSTDEEGARITKELCEQKGVKVLAVKSNVANSVECDDLVKQALEFGEGKIDILVNNAGITRDGLLGRMKDEDLDAVIDVNLKGTFYMMRAVSKSMLKNRSGRIINLSSVVGIMGNAGQVNYAATKAGVIGMTKSLARELASRHITVNAVAPGMISTDMTNSMSDKAKEAVIEQIPFKEAGKPEDVAGLVAFLTSEDSRYITGQVICVDGGMAI